MIETFTIVTTESTGAIRELHNRTPVIVQPAVFDGWLAASTLATELQAILARASADGLTAYPVSSRVNSVRNDDANLIEVVG